MKCPECGGNRFTKFGPKFECCVCFKMVTQETAMASRDHTVVKRWRRVHAIPNYLILEIGDAGNYEEVEEDGTVESDDLRICLILSGHTKILIDPHMRLVIEGDYTYVEELK